MLVWIWQLVTKVGEVTASQIHSFQLSTVVVQIFVIMVVPDANNSNALGNNPTTTPPASPPVEQAKQRPSGFYLRQGKARQGKARGSNIWAKRENVLLRACIFGPSFKHTMKIIGKVGLAQKPK